MLIYLKKKYNYLKFRIFKNKLSFLTNVLHIINYQIATLIYIYFNIKKIFDKKNFNHLNIKDNGFFIYKPKINNDFYLLRENIIDCFDNKKNILKINNKITFLNPSSFSNSQLLFMFSKNIIDLIENYYLSSFQIYSYHIYRTSFQNIDTEESYLWHTDNSTMHSLKLMIYLDDVDANSGAMNILNAKKSKFVFDKGFYDRNQYNNFKDYLDDVRDISVCTGNIGDIIIFRNSYCIHKATKPKVTKRDVININIYPSIKKFNLDFYKDNLNKTFFNSGYSLNPFNNSPQENLIEKKI
jgi:hypothetical protein